MSLELDNSSVWGRLNRLKEYDVIPLNVAELQFPTAKPIVEAMASIAKTGKYGYTEPFEEFTEVVKDWCSRRYDWSINDAQVVMVPRVVNLLAMLATKLSNIPPKVVTLTPHYAPTTEVLVRSGCCVKMSSLIEVNGTWDIDWEDLNKKLIGTDIFLLCSPHNPTGRVWSADELERISGLCAKLGVVVVADEVHADLVRVGQFIPFGKIAVPETQWFSAISPNKAFNLAGLETSAVICSSEEEYTWLKDAKRASGFHNANIFGLAALQVAWERCDDWLEDILVLIDRNIVYASTRIANELPGLRVSTGGATFLLWIDARKIGDEEKLRKWFVEAARIIPSFGSSFGDGFTGWIRLNLGIPPSRLDTVLERLISTAPKNALDASGHQW